MLICLSAVAKGQTQARGCAIVAAGKSWWWAGIPVAIEGEIPVHFAPKLDVVRSAQIEVHSARVRYGWKERSIQSKRGSIKSEKLQARSDQTRSDLLRQRWEGRFVVIDALPRETTIERQRSAARVLDNSSDASSEGALQLDPLD